MPAFNAAEKQILNDALDMALASNKRMQNSKPQFKEIFNKIETDIVAVKLRVNNEK